MKGQSYQGPPPGYLSLTEVAEALGMSRQNFHQSGLSKALDHWQIGRVTLYRQQDVDWLAHWLLVRKGLIALGHLAHNAPLNPTEGQWHQAVHEGYWDARCPSCQGYAVALPLEGPMWCPRCGISDSEDKPR